MRSLLLVLFAGLCAATLIPKDFEKDSQRQKNIYRLFKHINQPSYYQDHVEISKTYKFWENKHAYMKPEVVDEVYNYWYYGKLLQKDEIFSVFYNEHLKQAISLFKLFYYAKDYETFYQTAVWARNHMNQGMFLYSFSVALIHRPDTYQMVLPPIHEIYPHYFYTTEVIQKAQYYKQMYNGQNGAKFNDKMIYANYSGHYLNLHPEQSMSYFTEDVGINSFYYYYNLYYPFWMDGEEFNLKNDNRGELFYYMYQQILARYYLERLSNGFGQIKDFNWEVPFETGYYSSLCYPNGLHFPTRPNYAHLSEYFYNYGQKSTSKYAHSYTYVKDHERRIRDVIDSGFVYNSGKKIELFSHEGINVLGNLIEGNPDSPYYKYYGAYQIFARHLLGYSYQPMSYHKAYPSVLEHFETSLRDPAFYQLYKKLITYFMKFKAQTYKYYTEQDLIYEGVKITNVDMDRLETYFDYFHSDLSNAVYVTPEEYVKDSFRVQVAQQRLNHKPFTYKISVKSQTEDDVVVKVFLGPKYDEYGRYMNLTDNWMNFVQFDHFVYKMKAGQNDITRNSKEIYNYMHDRTTYYQLYKKTMGVYGEQVEKYYKNTEFWFGFPQRLMLPKGTHGGFPYQFYVFIYKHMPYKTQSTHVPMVGTGSQYVDGYPMGYPFDRPVYWEKMFHTIPNAYFYETMIYHRDVEFDSYSEEEYQKQYYKQKNYSHQKYYEEEEEDHNKQYGSSQQWTPQGYDQQFYKPQGYSQQYYKSQGHDQQQYYKPQGYDQHYYKQPNYDNYKLFDFAF